MKNLLYLSFVIIFFSCGNSAEEESISAKIDSLEQEIEELKQANDTLSDHLMQKNYLTRDYPPYFDTNTNPEEFLLKYLAKKAKLIPKNSDLGGTMRFTKVTFINDELFLAEFEDGHIMGKAVYSYTMDKRGNLSYNLVGSVK